MCWVLKKRPPNDKQHFQKPFKTTAQKMLLEGQTLIDFLTYTKKF